MPAQTLSFCHLSFCNCNPCCLRHLHHSAPPLLLFTALCGLATASWLASGQPAKVLGLWGMVLNTQCVCIVFWVCYRVMGWYCCDVTPGLLMRITASVQNNLGIYCNLFPSFFFTLCTALMATNPPTVSVTNRTYFHSTVVTEFSNIWHFLSNASFTDFHWQTNLERTQIHKVFGSLCGYYNLDVQRFLGCLVVSVSAFS